MSGIPVSLICIEVLSLKRAFYFINTVEGLNIDDYVVVETTRGIELGKVKGQEISKEITGEMPYTQVVRKANLSDIKTYEFNLEKEAEAVKFVQEEANKLNLGMNILSANFTLDLVKLIVCYFSEERVDFRELIKIIVAKYNNRVELKQVGTRDKARVVGGLGICGLTLCCSTFLNEFDGISITMAKNQMLSLNIPKLSGHCGKLICCLNYENDTYTELQKDLPRIGSKVKYNDQIYKITSMNVITKVMRLENKESVVNVPYDDIKDSILPRDYFEDNHNQNNNQNDNDSNNQNNRPNNQHHGHNNHSKPNRFKSSFEQKTTPRFNKGNEDEKN